METGEVVPVETFAAVLPYSGYTFITCLPSQRIEHFLDAIAAALECFGGVPRLIVPDNLRSAVKKSDRWSLDLTDGMNDLATHYGCNVMPARVRKPKDKALSRMPSTRATTAYTPRYATACTILWKN